MIAVFELGVVGMMVYLLVYQQGRFEAVSYLQIVGITALVYFLQWICIWIVGHVFLSVKNYANAIEQYYSLRALVCLLMYPLLVIAVNIPYMMVVEIVLGVIVGIYVILLSSKLLWLFYKNIMSLVYTVLYIVCLECIPAAAVMIWAKQIV